VSIQQIPPRPNPTDYASVSFLGWLDNLRNRVFQLIRGVGTSTNDNAVAGSVGEFVYSDNLGGGGVALTSTVIANITSISLTAGDWDVWGTVVFLGAATSTSVNLTGAISTANNTLSSLTMGGGRVQAVYPAGTVLGNTYPTDISIAPTRISLAATTTYYLNVYADFGVSTYAGYGTIAARRRR
jgi:hypothetical protein